MRSAGCGVRDEECGVGVRIVECGMSWNREAVAGDSHGCKSVVVGLPIKGVLKGRHEGLLDCDRHYFKTDGRLVRSSPRQMLIASFNS